MEDDAQKRGQAPDLATRLAALREHLFGRRGKADMARALHVADSVWGRYEKGENVPGADVLERLARAFPRVSRDWLVAGFGPMFNDDRPGPVPIPPELGGLAGPLSEPTPQSALRNPQLFGAVEAALADLAQRLSVVEVAVREVQAQAAAVPSIPQSAIRNLQWKVAQVYEAGFHIVDRDGAERHGPEGLVPILGRVAAGPGADTLEAVQYEPGDAESFLAYTGAPAGVVAVRVVGRSMEPEFREGDLVIVDPGRPTESGLACVIQRVGDTEVARLKKIRRRGRRVILESTAGGFAAEELPAQALVGAYTVIAHLPLRRTGGEGG